MAANSRAAAPEILQEKRAMKKGEEEFHKNNLKCVTEFAKLLKIQAFWHLKLDCNLFNSIFR